MVSLPVEKIMSCSLKKDINSSYQKHSQHVFVCFRILLSLLLFLSSSSIITAVIFVVIIKIKNTTLLGIDMIQPV